MQGNKKKFKIADFPLTPSVADFVCKQPPIKIKKSKTKAVECNSLLALFTTLRQKRMCVVYG